MKKISISIPCFNEEDNIENMVNAIENIFKKELVNYDYEIIFIDNFSVDHTREIIEKICMANKKVKAIFNVRNFGQNNSPYYGLMNTNGDCTITMACDFQDPVEMIPKFVKEWENGYKIVVGIKSKSKENKIVYFIRKIYYYLIKKFSNVRQINQFTGFGLYDKEFIEVLKIIKDPTPFLRGAVAEFGYKIKEVDYEQQLRKGGKSKNNFYSLYDTAMISFTSYTKVGLRLATFIGFFVAIISVIIGIVYFVLKLRNWNGFDAGMAPVVVMITFLGAVQLLFMGLMGEYILAINERVKNRPLVIEEKRINFDE